MTAAALGEDRGICFRTTAGNPPSKWALQEKARNLLPEHKGLQKCHCTRHRGGGGVKVWKGERGAWFSGLTQCGSVWICPVCAAKVADVRASELQKGIDYALTPKVGYGVMMVTLTFSHARGDMLAATIAGFSRALKLLKSGRAYQQFMREFGVIGEVRALEVTHGEENGWHPHTHAITFTDRKLTDGDRFRFECRLFLLWRAACIKAGIGAPEFGPGVHVRPAKDAANYVAKWGFATEVTRSHIKQAKGKGRTPWQLLADAAAGDKRAAWLFREFAQCFRGKRQLYYSPGLRQRLGLLDELTDQQALEIEPEEKILVCELDPDEWRMVVRFRARAEVLAAAMAGADELRLCLDVLRARTRAELGTDGSYWRGEYLRAVNEGWGTIEGAKNAAA